MDAAIRVDSLTKRYGRKVAVEDVSFAVEAGQVTGFLGPNGSGKTTVMRVLMGLITATSGRAEILGHSVASGSDAVRHEVGYLPGTLRLYENMTGGAFLEFVARIRSGRGRAEIGPLAERFAIPLRAPIADMSKGTRQKVGVVQAFMHCPSVLILDEPTSGLDPLVQREFEELLAERVRDGAAVLLSSHVLSEVERLATHVAMLDEGRLVGVGEIGSLASSIARRLTFEFAGPAAGDGFASCPGVSSADVDGNRVTVTIAGPETAVLRLAADAGAVAVTSHEPTLDDVFFSMTGRGRGR